MIPTHTPQRFSQLRFAWAWATIVVVETLMLAFAALPAVALLRWGANMKRVPEWVHVLFMAMLAVPSYVVFAFGLLVISAFTMRALKWRTQPNLHERIADFTWPTLHWGRYLISIHIVRLFAGPIFRSTPMWAMYMRWNGATIGRGVWVNSLSLMDHNLLSFDDGAVIGSDAHVSGHIVEGGILKTAPVHVGKGATIGVGSVVGIGSNIGDNTVVGALSVVPKFATLDANAVYAGAPVRKLERHDVSS